MSFNSMDSKVQQAAQTAAYRVSRVEDSMDDGGVRYVKHMGHWIPRIYLHYNEAQVKNQLNKNTLEDLGPSTTESRKQWLEAMLRSYQAARMLDVEEPNGPFGGTMAPNGNSMQGSTSGRIPAGAHRGGILGNTGKIKI